jgi:hypothetical protein
MFGGRSCNRAVCEVDESPSARSIVSLSIWEPFTPPVLHYEYIDNRSAILSDRRAKVHNVK